MAARKSSSTCSGLMISPLRTPRERDWPMPMMLGTPSAPCSPTTTQIFEVPISSPAMMLASSNIFPPGFNRFHRLGRRVRCGIRHDPVYRHVIGYRQIKRRDGFALVQPQVIDLPPAAQLLIQIIQTESNLAALPRGGD